jgi:hypothetical protein
MNKNSKNTTSIIGPLFGATVLGLIIFNFTVTRPRFIRIQATLEGEIRTLAPPQDTTLLRYHSAHDGYKEALHMAGAGASYKSSLPYEKIFLHYKQELQQHGWIYLKTEDDGRDIKEIYCKGDYTGTIGYGKVSSSDGWNYGVFLKYKENLVFSTLSGCEEPPSNLIPLTIPKHLYPTTF